MLMIPVDVQSTRPIYLQIADHITSLARSGQLAPGTRLPASRMLADQLQIHRSTVVNAYEELKARGLIDAQQGSGSYIADTVRDFALVRKPAQAPQGMTQPENLVAELWRLSQADGVISLALGMPDDELIPVETFEQARMRVLRRDRGQAFNYEDPQGYYPLRRAIAADLARHGIVTEPENIIVTWGAQEAVSLSARAFAAFGDWALLEAPSYFSSLFNLHRMGFNLLGFTLGEEGPNWQSLADALKVANCDDCDSGDALSKRPRFTCVVPDHHNPTGIRWSMAERHRFLRLMAQLDIAVIEDATYRDLTYDGVPHLPLRALEPDVLYAGSFSKSLMPGIRVGFLVAQGRMRDQLVTLKTLTCGSGESLGQRTLTEYLTCGDYAAHLERIVPIYRRRRDAMLDALAKFFPPEIHWNQPTGGYFIWVTLPDSIPVERVFQEALERGVAVAPAPAFYTQAPVSNAIRLAFSRHSEATLVHAVRLLGNLLTSMLRQASPQPVLRPVARR